MSFPPFLFSFFSLFFSRSRSVRAGRILPDGRVGSGQAPRLQKGLQRLPERPQGHRTVPALSGRLRSSIATSRSTTHNPPTPTPTHPLNRPGIAPPTFGSRRRKRNDNESKKKKRRKQQQQQKEVVRVQPVRYLRTVSVRLNFTRK